MLSSSFYFIYKMVNQLVSWVLFFATKVSSNPHFAMKELHYRKYSKITEMWSNFHSLFSEQNVGSIPSSLFQINNILFGATYIFLLWVTTFLILKASNMCPTSHLFSQPIAVGRIFQKIKIQKQDTHNFKNISQNFSVV